MSRPDRRFRLIDLKLGVVHCPECHADHTALRREVEALRREVDRLGGAVAVLGGTWHAEPPED